MVAQNYNIMKKYIKYSVILFALLSIPIYLTYKFDSAIEPMESYIRSNHEINVKVGKVESIQIRKLIYVSSSVNHPKHRIYVLHVNGSNNDLWLKIKAVNYKEKKSWSFNIVSMN